MLKETIFFLVLLISTSLFSQQSQFDKYQYIIVPHKFDFVNSTDQFQTSSLTKFLLRKKGFKVFLSNEKLPEDLQNNSCIGLRAIVKDESSMFITKSKLVIQDCYNKVLYTSKIGKSKEKIYQKGYREAIRKAFDSMTDFEYTYKPSLLLKKKENQEVISSNTSSNEAAVQAKKIVQVVEISEINKEGEKEENLVSNSLEVLYAQQKNNGFQLVNTKPEVVFVILKTNLKDVFVIKDVNGIFYKVGENWVSEYYENNQFIRKEFQVNF